MLKLCNQVAAKTTASIWPRFLAEILCCRTELVITWSSGYTFLTSDRAEHLLDLSQHGNCVVLSLVTTQWTCILGLSPLLYAWNATNDIFTFAAGCSRQGGHPKTNVTPEHPDQKVAHSFLCPWHWVFRGTLAFFRLPQFGYVLAHLLQLNHDTLYVRWRFSNLVCRQFSFTGQCSGCLKGNSIDFPWTFPKRTYEERKLIKLLCSAIYAFNSY